jgi:hypothetical protein
VDGASYYSIAYGIKSGEYIYGVPNTGNVTTFTVGGLDPNQTYYFQVRAVHDCMPGDPSNQSSSGAGGIGGGDVLGVTTLGATGSNTIARLFVSLIAMGVAYVALKSRSVRISQ